jgi:hypothetical protein
MFAANGANKVYHLVEAQKRTVCGLTVMGVVLSRSNLPVVRPVEAPPQDHKFCPHCERLAPRVSFGSVDGFACAVA